ncbi:hypothetical protein KM043_012534 [Ampulex compressa]|nr:hypothetical protein KM043_012534 [Ampulex compressa]
MLLRLSTRWGKISKVHLPMIRIVNVLDLKAEGKKYLDAETAVFQLKQSKSRDSETAWLKTALAQGTTSDKIAAGIVLVQDNPKYNLARLTALVNQVRAAKQNQCSMVITALRDLFLSDLLHPNFKLLKFEEQDLNQINTEGLSDGIMKFDTVKKKLLAHWYFEDQLREHYERFIMGLAGIASDTVDTNREKAIAVMTDLLIGNAEQEHKLLGLIVNKVGDPSSKVGSKAVFCLTNLLHEHPNMKLVVLQEIEKLLFRKNMSSRAQYYAICLLTQFVLEKTDEAIAATLIEVYFAFFNACLKKGEPDSRMMAGILTGVNRAYPFAKLDSVVLQKHIDSVYKVVHVGSFNVSLNALSLLHQVCKKNVDQSNRFYSTFYRKLLDPQIGIANKRAIFLNLLYRVLQSDQSVSPCKATNAKETPLVSIEESSIILTNVTIEPKSDLEAESDTKIKTEYKVENNEQNHYDPFCRNPLYAGATKSFTTELVALVKHYHPSVALFANTIIQGKSIDYTGNPLEDLTLIRFLDRYVYKNPKKLETKKVQRNYDPLAKRAGYTPKGIRSIPVDSASYLNEREDRIPVDELYLYQYLKKKNEAKVLCKEEDDDIESVNSEEFNDMLDRLGGNKDLEDMDVAADIQSVKSKKGSKVDNDSDDDYGDDDDDNDDDNSSDEGGDNDSDLEDFGGSNVDNGSKDLIDIDDDLSDIDFNDDSDEDEIISDVELGTKNNGKKLKKEKRTQKSKKGIDENIFVSAEKFAEMLEEQSRTKSKHGSTNTFSSADGASLKQIDWETKRHQKLHGTFNRKKRKGSAAHKKNVKKIKR